MDSREGGLQHYDMSIVDGLLTACNNEINENYREYIKANHVGFEGGMGGSMAGFSRRNVPDSYFSMPDNIWAGELAQLKAYEDVLAANPGIREGRLRIVQQKMYMCIRRARANWHVPARMVQPQLAPASPQPPIAVQQPPVPIARAAADVAAAAAAVTAKPGAFDKYADDALAVRSSTELHRDQAMARLISNEVAAIEKKYPVTQCADSEDRIAFAACLKVRNEALFKRAEAEIAYLDGMRPNITNALYNSDKAKFELGASLARDSCAKLTGSTAPCDLSAGSASRPNLPSRVIARDGRNALDCVKLVDLAQANSSTSGSGRVLANQCTDTVEIGWCSTGGECERGAGNQTTVLAGHSWPVDRNHEVRWGACHGANTLHGDPGSKGLQFTCSAPYK